MLTCLAALAVMCSPSANTLVGASDRPMGHVFDWGHELTQKRLPQWRPATAPPIEAPRWNAAVTTMLRRAGANGLWFSGYNGLPFDIPTHPKDPTGWKRPANLATTFAATGLSWDVNLEARAASNALARRWAVVANPTTTAPTRRLSLLDPGYERAATAEIRRLVPRYAALPYVHAYTGTDEPVAVLPRGPAVNSAFAKRLRAQVRAEFGHPAPLAGAAPTRSVAEGLRWLAYSRYVSDRFFAMKRRQATLIRRLDPGAVIVPNDYLFLDGFMPWDYTQLEGVADIVEADPYESLSERSTPGRGSYNHGFAAKFLSDLTGAEVRIIVQAFPYAGYRPRPADLERWTQQALRAGATHISFYALDNPRFTDPARYSRMLGIARRLRGTRLPARPADPSTVVVYATASEGQAQPHRNGESRYRTSGDALATTYAALGELAHSAFVFDSDTRLLRDPARLARATTVWLPRADTLDRAFAAQLVAWVRQGGTLIVTDPAAFTRSPDGAPLADLHAAVLGGVLGPRRSPTPIRVPANSIAAGIPAQDITIPPTGAAHRPFAALPPDAVPVATDAGGAPVGFRRTVGAGRVIAFATDLMHPGALLAPAGLREFVRSLQQAGGGALDHPAWAYTLPS